MRSWYQVKGGERERIAQSLVDKSARALSAAHKALNRNDRRAFKRNLENAEARYLAAKIIDSQHHWPKLEERIEDALELLEMHERTR